MKLDDTIGLMCSDNYKDRLKAEYLQLVIRLKKLTDYWVNLEDKVSVEGSYALEQITVMKEYRIVLRKRMLLNRMSPNKLDDLVGVKEE